GRDDAARVSRLLLYRPVDGATPRPGAARGVPRGGVVGARTRRAARLAAGTRGVRRARARRGARAAWGAGAGRGHSRGAIRPADGARPEASARPRRARRGGVITRYLRLAPTGAVVTAGSGPPSQSGSGRPGPQLRA